MKNMICPRCNNPLEVTRNNETGNIEITCYPCGYCCDTENNVRDAQKVFFNNVGLMDGINQLRNWVNDNF
jgi:hypothetical protein